MHLIRLAYATQFLLAVVAIFVLWSEVGGQGHLDLVPWYVKFTLGTGAALAFVMATAAAVSRPRTWNGRTLAWAGILLVLLIACGLASYYVHLYDEDSGDEDEENVAVTMVSPRIMGVYGVFLAHASACRAGCPDGASDLGLPANGPVARKIEGAAARRHVRGARLHGIRANIRRVGGAGRRGQSGS
jgi:hypothetical protein